MICKVESKQVSKDVVSLYYRIKKGSGTKKAVNRFRNHLHEKMGMTNKLPTAIISRSDDTPTYGRTGIAGDGCVVNIISSENYIHIVAVMEMKKRPKFVEGMKYFHAIKK